MLLPLFSRKSRRYQAIYYILTGKRTVSNLLAGLTYDLLPYFHFYPKLPQADYQAALQQLMSQQYLKVQSETTTIRLTALGQLAQVQLLQRQIWPQSYDYWRDGDWQLQWERLLLSVQVISNYQHQQRHYAPLATQPLVQAEIRQWFYRSGRRQQHQFVKDLIATVTGLPKDLADLLANSLRSNAYAGTSDFQLGLDLNLTADELSLKRIAALSQFIHAITFLPQQSPLRQVFPAAPSPLSRGAEHTYTLWQAGQPWSTIVKNSYQKEGTLLEHLLEAAILVPDFNFESLPLQQLIAVNPESYFAQRLSEIQAQRRKND